MITTMVNMVVMMMILRRYKEKSEEEEVSIEKKEIFLREKSTKFLLKGRK